MVAGVLHHLGVDMGDVPTVEQLKRVDTTRHYRGFECQEAIRQFAQLPADATCGQMMHAAGQYIGQRLMSADGPVGVKLNPLLLLARCDGLERLPLTVVSVGRNLESTFSSDIKYRGVDWERAAQRGIYDLAWREFVRRVPPVCHVPYEQAIAAPRLWVWTLMCALGLKPDAAQFEAAIEFVNPIQCKWEVA